MERTDDPWLEITNALPRGQWFPLSGWIRRDGDVVLLDGLAAGEPVDPVVRVHEPHVHWAIWNHADRTWDEVTTEEFDAVCRRVAAIAPAPAIDRERLATISIAPGWVEINFDDEDAAAQEMAAHPGGFLAEMFRRISAGAALGADR